MFRFLYAIWPKSKDLHPTYLKATKPPSVQEIHLVTNKTLKAVTRIARLACIDSSHLNTEHPWFGGPFKYWTSRTILRLFISPVFRSPIEYRTRLVRYSDGDCTLNEDKTMVLDPSAESKALLISFTWVLNYVASWYFQNKVLTGWFAQKNSRQHSNIYNY